MTALGGIGGTGETSRHVPVLLAEVLAALAPADGEVVIDGTFGAGGYSRAILEAADTRVLAIDRDPTAIAAGAAMVAEFAGRLSLVHDRFSGLDIVAAESGHAGVDAVVLDIGVSSMQIDEAERGFSFRHDGPLDMRMSGKGASAADVVNTYKLGDLARVFGFLGEERQAGRIARMIEDKRARRLFSRTAELADAIQTLVGRGPKDKIHPATRVFQALRIHVNDELGELARALFAAERALKPGGRLVVVTFHSLEDRIVKRFIADRAGKASGSRHLPEAHFIAPTFADAGKAIATSEAEAEANPRARSAKLRAATRTETAPRAADFSIFGLPKLPAIGDAEETH